MGITALAWENRLSRPPKRVGAKGVWIAPCVLVLVVLLVLVWRWNALDGTPATAQQSRTTGESAVVAAPAHAGKPKARREMSVSERRALRDHLAAQSGAWGFEDRVLLLTMEPSYLLDLLDDDALLARDETRDLLRDIYGSCGIAMGLAYARSRGRDTAAFDHDGTASRDRNWCIELIRRADGSIQWERFTKLMDLVRYAAPEDAHSSERTQQRVMEAANRADGSLEALLLQEDPMLVVTAMETMQAANNANVVTDWSPITRLDSEQRQLVWTALWRGLECQSLGDCSAQGFATTALCNYPSIQCDAGADYYAAVRRSLSPAQFDALSMLMREIEAYRREHGG